VRVSRQSASTLAADEELDQRFEKDCFEVLVSDEFGKRGDRTLVLSSSILSSNRTSIVAMGYLGLFDTRGGGNTGSSPTRTLPSVLCDTTDKNVYGIRQSRENGPEHGRPA